MRLGIDAREIQNGIYTGIGQPLSNFINYFAKLQTDDRCILFSSKPIPIDLPKHIKNVIIKESLTFYWDQVRLPKALKREKVDLFYSPYYKIPLKAPCKCISAILDLMYLIYPEYKKKLGFFKSFYYATMGKRMAQKADRILTCSEHSKKDIVKIYGIDTAKIDVIPLSISQIYRPAESPQDIEHVKKRFKITGKYILYMGNFKPHKNVKTIIRAFKKLTKEFHQITLVLAGPKTHQYQELVSLVENLSLTNKVIFTGKILKEDNPQYLYAGAEIFAMPTFYEGFGLPPVEAMSCGTPVVGSNTTSLPEVIKDAGLLIDPKNIDDLYISMKRILSDDQLGKDMIAKGRQYAREYNEDNINKQMYTYFKNIIEGKS